MKEEAFPKDDDVEFSLEISEYVVAELCRLNYSKEGEFEVIGSLRFVFIHAPFVSELFVCGISFNRENLGILPLVSAELKIKHDMHHMG